MGCGQKAVAEGEDDWDNLKDKAELRGVPWKVYSREARAAEFLFRKDPKVKGMLLKFDVLAAVALDDLKNAQSTERAELVKALELTKKFA